MSADNYMLVARYGEDGWAAWMGCASSELSDNDLMKHPPMHIKPTLEEILVDVREEYLEYGYRVIGLPDRSSNGESPK